MKTEEILNEREKTHGDYKDTARLSWSFKHTVREELDSQSKDMRRNVDIGQQEAIEMILHKIARIICGDPNHSDHWDDIAGYAMLGKGEDKEEECKKCENRMCACMECLKKYCDGKIVDFYTKEEAKPKGNYHVMKDAPKCDKCGEECETTCFTLKDIDSNKRFCPKCTGEIAGEACRRKGEEKKCIHCRDPFCEECTIENNYCITCHSKL